MSWNSTRLRRGLCTEWQKHLYTSWYNHGLSIHGMSSKNDNKAYSGVIFAKCFYDFRCFYNVIKRDPLFSQFCSNPEIYAIDKDGLYKEWSPRSIQIVTKQQNNSIMHLQNPFVTKTAVYSRVKKVVAIDPAGKLSIYDSLTQASSTIGVSVSVITQCCKQYYGGNCVQRGKFKGWRFSYL